jgi:hypothetical protein
MERAAVLVLSMLVSSLAYGPVRAPNALSVPSLDEGGLIALIALVGVVGGILARRRKK